MTEVEFVRVFDLVNNVRRLEANRSELGEIQTISLGLLLIYVLWLLLFSLVLSDITAGGASNLPTRELLGQNEDNLGT